MKPATRKVLNALAYIENTTKLPATVRQVAAESGYRGHAGVLRQLDKLEADGAVSRAPGVARSIQITPKGKRLARADQ